jgi:hypothetical protein
MYWATSYPDRFKSEIWLMNQNTNARLVRLQDNRLRWQEWIVNNLGDEFLLAITYPENFPTQSPIPSVLKPDIKPAGAYYMFENKIICAMPSSSYSPNITAYAIRNRACAWTTFYGLYDRFCIWYGPTH